MEETVKERKPTPLPGKSKLRYPLRSAAKSKEEKLTSAELSTSKRGRVAGAVSKSVSVLDLSGKEKSAKPPRRLSIPTKSVPSPVTRPTLNITPIPEARIKRTNNGQNKNETPASSVSRTASRNRLTSSAYWLSQIKLSESAAKHSLSLGFFKLALEAGCKPLEQLRNELKSYVRRHELGEAGGVMELFEGYNIADSQEQNQVSQTCSQVHEEVTRSSDDEVHSSSSVAGTRKLSPRSLNANAANETGQKHAIATRTRTSLNKTPNVKSISDNVVNKSQKKLQKPTKQETGKRKDKIKKPGKKYAAENDSVSPSAAGTTAEENKENVIALPTEEISQTEG
ncbi:hypothetical protein K2173_027058 [Erythroxylum novogranatense]|uniref:Uncharacterized protein n=1 Tax=Erythroxylum novogranatense TaxID=1862640 RepID=A0AAV8TY02_9ROSI|nr:hypothetical protein K2173_027058 [Erythroxylum novogranatense]